MQTVYVRTNDFRMAYRLLRELQLKHLNAQLVDLEQDLPDPKGWWFGTPDEVERLGGNGIGTTADTVKEAVLNLYRSFRELDVVHRLTVGIDPGPRPGCAWLVEGMLLGKSQDESVEDAVSHVIGLVRVYGPMVVDVRIGHGSPLHRDRLINRFLSEGYQVSQVNEHRTSRGTGRHEHASSALKIALLKGDPVLTRRTVEPTEGELRNIQRLSRKRSKGTLTISLQEAHSVACGGLTMEEALWRAGYSDSLSESSM
ncbi:MAG: hypothetical protein HOL29_00410 [Euryarchaeota archaeon]|nr:hypothetical protein [Euryarchaeota archaeon]